MQSTSSKRTASPRVSASNNPTKASRRAADALLREHPDAMVFAQATDGSIVPVPESLGLDGYPVFAEGGRTGVDFCVAEDRMTVVNAWIKLKTDGVAEAKARLRSEPDRWWTVRMLDLRKRHGVVLSVAWPSPEGPTAAEAPTANAPASTTPRFCSRRQDQEGNVIDCDEAYLQMFGYASKDEVLGKPTFDRVHPEDQARLIESWIAMVATGRVQMSRVRVKCHDDSWLWVDTTYHNYLAEEHDPHVLAECIDISAEMAAQEALEDREELLRHLLEDMPDGLLQLGRDLRVVYHNARLREILHATPETQPDEAGASPPAAGQPQLLAYEPLLKALTVQSRARLDAVLHRALAHATPEDFEADLSLPEGEQRHILMKIRPLQRHSGIVTGLIISALDVTDSTNARRELEKQATLDGLTGAYNRSSIVTTLTSELRASTHVAVLYVDIDHFKAINDSFGHTVGDEALIHIAERLKGALRTTDELGRLGGDEFLVLLRDVSAVGVAMDAAERISEALRGPCELTGASVELCASVGVAWAGNQDLTPEQLIEQADAAMYRSKEQRRGTPVLASRS